MVMHLLFAYTLSHGNMDFMCNTLAHLMEPSGESNKHLRLSLIYHGIWLASNLATIWLPKICECSSDRPYLQFKELLFVHIFQTDCLIFVSHVLYYEQTS